MPRPILNCPLCGEDYADSGLRSDDGGSLRCTKCKGYWHYGIDGEERHSSVDGAGRFCTICEKDSKIKKRGEKQYWKEKKRRKNRKESFYL